MWLNYGVKNPYNINVCTLFINKVNQIVKRKLKGCFLIIKAINKATFFICCLLFFYIERKINGYHYGVSGKQGKGHIENHDRD